MLSIAKRLQRIEAAINDVRRDASYIGALNGARNPEDSLEHAESLERNANVIVDQAFEIVTFYARSIARREKREAAKKK